MSSSVDQGVQVVDGGSEGMRPVESPVVSSPSTSSPAEVVHKDITGNQLHKVVVEGREVEMTTQQLIRAAEKVEGADKKFREAAEGRKVLDIYNKMNEGISTIQEREDYCNIFKLEGQQRESILNLSEEGGEGYETPGEAGTTGGEAEPRLLRLEDCDPTLRNLLERANKTTVAKENEDFDSQATEQIKKDELSNKMLTNLEPPRREEAETALLEMVRAEIIGRLQAGAAYGPVLLKDVVARVASRVERIGVQTQKPDTPIPGLSPTDNSMAKVIKSDDPIERVSSTDPRFADNMAARVIRKAMTLVGSKT